MSKQSDLVSVSQGASGDPLFIDTVNDRIGIGTAAPQAPLHIEGEGLYVNRAAGDPYLIMDTSGGSTTAIYGGSSGVRAFTGGTERMRIDTAGRVTMPYQPAFRAVVNNESYLTTSPVPFGTTTLNVGNHFNTGTYTFTAPIAGVYFIFVGVYLRTDNNEDAYPQLSINGVSVQYSYLYNLGNGGRIDNTVVVARIISLSASDTVSVLFGGTGGEYFGGYRETYFSGYLLG